MGGIKLDWHVESEQSQVRATEDPEIRRQRQEARRKLLAILAALVLVLALVGAGIYWRLRSVDNQLRQDLIDTVQAEITAIKVGNFANFYAIQRSANDAFLFEQNRLYEEYQTLKQAGRITLTGEIVSVTIDDQRGRVVLEEVRDGIPYRLVWYYWRYEDNGDQSGWRHVPADLTFWGDKADITTGAGRISYRTLDEGLARALADALPVWWTRGCAILACDPAMPTPRLNIVADRPASIAWTAADSWTLRITSPLVDRARADQLLPPALAGAISEALAERMVRYVTGDPALHATSDAAWLFEEYGRWVARQMRGEEPAADAGGLIETLITSYGPGVPDTLLTTLPTLPALDGIFWSITGLSIAQLSTDQLDDLTWGDFFQWRLALEPALVAAQDRTAYYALYDLTDSNAQSWADARFNEPAYATQPVLTVQSVTIVQENGVPYAYVAAAYVENDLTLRDETYIWRLADGTWKRVR